MFECWFRTAVVWTRIFTMRLLSIWVTCQSHRSLSLPELSELASSGNCPHAVATARVGRDETGGQGAIPEETADAVRLLQHHDQVQYVQTRGTLPLWLSCGDAQCRGVTFGKVCHRT